MKFGTKTPKNESNLEVGYQRRPSAFDLKRFGIKEDPNKEYRWSTPERVNEHKHLHRYEVHQAKDGEHGNESNAIETKGKMILLERDRSVADASRRDKILRTESQTRSVREMRREDFEKLSSKHGVDLHKHFMNKFEKLEDEDGG